MLFKYLTLTGGVFACSTAVVFVKWSTEHPVLVASYRLLVATLFLLPLMLRDIKRMNRKLNFTDIRPSIIPGLALGVHFIAWITGARMTPAANSTLVVSMGPAIMPVFALLLYNERVNLSEMIGTGISLGGIILLGISDLQVNISSLIGDILCFIAMVFGTFYLALARKNRSQRFIWIYLVPLYFIGGVFCLGVSLLFTNPLKAYNWKDITAIVALALIPTILGHSILNYSMRHIRGQVVTLVNLCQFVFAGIMGYFFFSEVLGTLFYISCIPVVLGAYIAIRYREKTESPG